MNPPDMRPWNLALRFGLEMAALVGFGLAAWHLSSGIVRWTAVVAVPLVAAVLWGTLNVLDDPSRSGNAPVEVSGRVRLVVEAIVLGGGWIAYGTAGHRALGVALAVLTVLHYAVAFGRVRWLLSREP